MTATMGNKLMSGGSSTGLMKEKIPGGYKKGVLNNYTPEQMNLFQSLFGPLGPDSQLSKLAMGDEDTFNQMEAPAMKQFNALQGNIANRFSGMGTGGRHSSGFQNATTAAAQDFAGQLQQNRQSLSQQALKDLMGMSSMLLGQRPQEKYLTQKEPSFMDRWMGLAGNVMGHAAQGAAMGGF